MAGHDVDAVGLPVESPHLVHCHKGAPSHLYAHTMRRITLSAFEEEKHLTFSSEVRSGRGQVRAAAAATWMRFRGIPGHCPLPWLLHRLPRLLCVRAHSTFQSGYTVTQERLLRLAASPFKWGRRAAPSAAGLSGLHHAWCGSFTRPPRTLPPPQRWHPGTAGGTGRAGREERGQGAGGREAAGREAAACFKSLTQEAPTPPAPVPPRPPSPRLACWYSDTRSFMLLSASVNSISSCKGRSGGADG